MLLIVDGNNLAHRARHVFNLSNKGVDVSVTYGFLRVLQSLISKYSPESILVAFDGGTPDFRRQAVPEYKANRHKDEDPFVWDDFNRQMNELCDYILPLMGVVVVKKVGAEADDVMYHASRMCVGNSIIVTSDKDLLQAISPSVSVLSPSKDLLYTYDNFHEYYDIDLKHYIEWRALQGDSSDNIPGIVGVGEKTATKLFKTFGNLTGIVNAALGHNPEGALQGRIATSMIAFGWERITKNVMIMSLYADRVGCRESIKKAISDYAPADKIRIKKYFLRNGFVSLLEGKFIHQLSMLCKPQMSYKGYRFPTTIGKRMAYK